MATATERGPVLAPRRDGERVLVLTVLGVAVASWVLVVVLHGADTRTPTPGGAHAGHGRGPDVVMWLLGWTAMLLAMMGPPALPLLRTMRRVGRRAGRPGRVLAATAGAFAGAWLLAGVALLAVGEVLRPLVSATPWLAARPGVVVGAAWVGAGLYQLSPLRRACLTACRSPAALVLTTWTGTRSPVAEAGETGLRYAAVCVGCCWALMGLALVVGTAALPVMVIAALVMALERLAPSVRTLVPVVALAMVAAGIALACGVLPDGLAR